MNSSQYLIDVNCDLGETQDGILDEEIMPYISSCNIACGGHFGDESTMKRTITLAKQYHVAVGAHPSFPDKKSFGRAVLKMDLSTLKADLENQIIDFLKLCDQLGVHCHHVKPHGALYNIASVDARYAECMLEVMNKLDSNLFLYGLAESELQKRAEIHKIPFVPEAFADRRYESDKTLRSRKKDGAVLKGKEVIEQVVSIAMDQQISIDNRKISLKAKTICLHSDTLGAVSLAKEIHKALVQKGIKISAV
jgi:UPF0271 protein